MLLQNDLLSVIFLVWASGVPIMAVRNLIRWYSRDPEGFRRLRDEGQGLIGKYPWRFLVAVLALAVQTGWPLWLVVEVLAGQKENEG